MTLKVLVVDDHYVNRRVLSKLLENIANVDIVVNGLEAVEAVKASIQENRPYDLILLDIMMPEMDGQETLTRIRDIEMRKGILTLDGVKVIMVTAISEPKSIMKAFRSGCEGYIVKPVVKDALYEQMRKLGLNV